MSLLYWYVWPSCLWPWEMMGEVLVVLGGVAEDANGWVVIEVLAEKEIQGGRDVGIMEVPCVEAEFSQVCNGFECEG